MTSTTKSGARKSPTDAKLEHPAKEFSNPGEVVTDRSLSTQEKQAALDSLEQDARQLAVATAEGMVGGEETKLRNVLEAERSLDQPSEDLAFSTVLRTFEQHRENTLGTDTDILITRAIESINEARAAIGRQKPAAKVPAGAPKPGSKEELEEELNKEKLDPGG